MIEVDHFHGSQEPVTETSWSWVCPRKRSTIGAERCSHLQKIEKCRCDKASKAPTKKERESIRKGYSPSLYGGGKLSEDTACFFSSCKSLKSLQKCPIGKCKTWIVRGDDTCKYMEKTGKNNNARKCRYYERNGRKKVVHEKIDPSINKSKIKPKSKKVLEVPGNH